MLHRVARLRVDGVRIFLAILIVEIAIVAAGGHGDVAHVNHILQFLVGIERVVGRLVDADAPRHLLLAVAAYYDFASNLHHEVLNTFLFQVSCHDVGAITFGDGRAVEHGVRILLAHETIFQGYLVEAYDGTKAVDGLLGGRIACLEAESPGINHWGYGDIEGSVGFA